MKKLIIIFAVIVLFGAGFARAGTWTTVDYPGANQTRIRDIDGGNLVGSYQDNSGLWHGFVRSGTTWTTLDAPGATLTLAHGMSGGNIVGYYSDASYRYHGFLYDGSTWTTIDAAGAYNTYAYGIDEGTIVGSYDGHGFIYDGTTWTTFDVPGGIETRVYDIDGGNIAGYFRDPASRYHEYRGFVYDGTTWTTLDAPIKMTCRWCKSATFIYGISGSNLVGVGDEGGFLYNGTTWQFFNAPGVPPIPPTRTKIWGIDGYKLVGSYRDDASKEHGFVYKIAESAPVACIADGNQTIEAQGPFGATVTLDGSCSSDADSTPGTNDDINDFNWYEIDPCDPDNEIYRGSGQVADCNLPLGEHTIVLEVTDKTGLSDSNEIVIVVQDTTPPEFNLSVAPAVLWPVNHKMVKITPTCTASDLCDESPEVSLVDITMNETGNSEDIQISDDDSIYLCAERSGNAKGRIYTITYEACDDSGNCAIRIATVTVPHDNRK